MKNIYILLIALVASSSLAFSQVPKGRTATTIVADVLAQSPYAKVDDYNNAMKALMGTKDEGVLQLVQMMKAPAVGNNAKMEYALNGLTYYAANSGEANRLAISEAYIKALDATKDRETQAFIIRQLGVIGKEEAISKLATFLNSESLSSPAAIAIAAIDTPTSADVLISNLRSATNNTVKADLVNALGFTGSPDAEIIVKGQLNSGNPVLEQTAIQALSRVGTANSLKELENLAKKANYELEYTNATGAYLKLIQRLIKNGDIKNAEKAAKSLESSAKKAKAYNVSQAALQLMMDCKPEEANKMALNALKDPCPQYRIAALKYAMTKGQGSTLMYEVMSTFPKAKDDVKLTIVRWLAEEANSPANIELIKKIAFEPLVGQLSSGNEELQQAIATVFIKTEDARAIEPLANLVAGSDEASIIIGRDALKSLKGNVSDVVITKLNGASDASTLAILDILATRKASKYLSEVIKLTNTGSPVVKEAAYETLQSLVEAKDINTMYTMLEGASANNVAPLQEAVIASLNYMPAAKRFNEISGKLAKTPKDKQYLYYTALAATKDPKALDVIVEGFKSNNKTTKDAAFDALASWTNIDAAETLLDICKDNAASSYFDRAMETYIKLASNPKLTPENRVIYLRDAMEIAKTDAQKKSILNQIRNTGTFQGLIFAGEFLDQAGIQEAAAQAVMNIALNNKDINGPQVEALLNKVVKVLNNPDAGYQKEAIYKHLRENPMKNGFVSMFNGKDLSGWKGLVENPIARSKMSPAALAKAQAKADETLGKDWFVEDGHIVFDGKTYDNLCTEKPYGDFEMYVDWKLDPNGPEPDAGLYLRGTPQVQIWDIARTNVGAEVGSGGLYNNSVHRSTPLKVADNKLGMWNTFYIKMVGDRVTVYLNGELVTDDIILENYWDRKQPIFPIEQIELQAHGSKVYYRDLYIKELERAKPFELSEEEKKEGFEILFDGTNMHKWTGNITDYTLEDGTISLVPSKGSGGNLYTKDEFDNFIFRFDFQLTPGANNGVGIRTPMEGDAAYVGMEIQILDHDDPIYEKITPLQVHGSVYGVIPADRAKHKPIGEWSTEEIIANGDNIKVTLDGVVLLDGNLKEAMKNGAADGLDHPGVKKKSGHIGFLGHGNPIKFRNIRVKKLK